MTVREKQCLLCLLGLYDGEIDGIWGPKSARAEAGYREKYGALDAGAIEKIKNTLAEKKEDWWEEIEFFHRREFACKCGCGCPVEMSRMLVQVADRVRRHFGTAAIVSSGLRCKTHNAAVGGVSNSRHLVGKAMDFCIQGRTAAQVLAFVQAQPEIRYAYAIDGQFVHMDVE